MSRRPDTTTVSSPALMALGVGVLLVASAAAGCRGNRSSEPPVHLNQNMDFQQYYEGQEKNAFFPDERAMREPVPGTVARTLVLAEDDRFLEEDDHYWRARGSDGRLVDALPSQIEVDQALLDRGEERYNIFCGPCHDSSGSGMGLAPQRGFSVMPPSFHTDRMRAMPIGYFFDVITRGKGSMMSYAAAIPTEDRWAIAVWARTLQLSQNAKLADLPTDVRSRFAQ